MRVYFLLAACLFISQVVLAQSDRGTMTGTVSDPSGAVVAGAPIRALNTQTGSEQETLTTATGNYTIPALTAGTYEISVEVPGFKKFIQQGIRIQVAQTARIDIALQVGASSDAVTVTADASILKTENAEQSTTIAREPLLRLPINFTVTAGGGLLNPLSFVNLTPGGWINNATTTTNVVRVGGQPNISYKLVIDGQDATNDNRSYVQGHNPTVESVEEFTLQTSNFAAEFGQVAGGMFNFTTRSGTNQFHGSAYEYFANDALDATLPYTHALPRVRKNDLGLSVGGPVYLPKLYNGRNRTFFFFSMERYFDRKWVNGVTSVPSAAMRAGDFSQVLTGRNLGTDSTGRPILENTIYDPATQRTVNGQVTRDPFPGNLIPQTRLDPVALKIQGLLPAPTSSGTLNNYLLNYPYPRDTFVPAVKIDQYISSKSKLSFWMQHYGSHDLSSPDGLPVPITATRDKHAYSYTERLNYDVTATPRLLFHAGIGEQRYLNPDSSPPSVMGYDAAGQLGLKGGYIDGFPRLTGLSASLGGMALAMGPSTSTYSYTDKWTTVLNATLVRGSHTWKAGAEWQLNPYTAWSRLQTTGVFNFLATESGLPSTQGQNLGGGSIGFPYASFLLGAVDSASVRAIQAPQFRKKSWSLFLQDDFKLTRTLTLNYGLRWDYGGQGSEIHNRMAEFSPATPNPSAGGLPGAVIFAGDGPGRCNCQFSNAYPYAIGPRLGIAFQINPNTVFRGGWGLIYGATAQYQDVGQVSSVGVGFNQLDFTSSAYGDPSVLLRNGLQYNPADLSSVNLNPGIRPSPGQINSPPFWIDPNAGRPPRINQWNLALQRRITENLSLEAAYVGSRAVWYEADTLLNLNATDPSRLAAFGLNIGAASDQSLLTSQMSSPQVQARGFKAPYAGFPMTLTLAQALRPYPQFGNIPVWWAPLGDTWYDSLQAKLTKRASHGLSATAAFTWQKELQLGSDTSTAGAAAGPVTNPFNRILNKSISPSSQPLVLVVGFNYQAPAVTSNRLLRAAVRDWTLGGVLRYASGLPIPTPAAQNSLSALLFQNTLVNRIPGQSLFLKDLNCHCIDPNKDFVLNPAAWSNPAQGQWGTAAPYYNDFRYERRPEEQLSLGRMFRLHERVTLQVRAEFFNVFNRGYMVDPTAANAFQTQTRNSLGVPTSGFGYINSGSIYGTQGGSRNGQLVARFQW